MSASSALGSNSAKPSPAASTSGSSTDAASSAYATAFSKPKNFEKEIKNASRAQASLDRAYKKDIKNMKGEDSSNMAQAMKEFKSAQSNFAEAARTGSSDIQQKHMIMLNAKSVLIFNSPQKSKLRSAKMQKQLTKLTTADVNIYNKGTQQASKQLGLSAPPALKVPKSFRKDRKTVAKNQKRMRKGLDKLLKKSRNVDGTKLNQYQKDKVKKAVSDLNAYQSNFVASMGSGASDIPYAWDSLKTAHKAVQEAANEANVSLNGSKSGNSYWKLNQVSQSLFANCQNNLNAQLAKNPKPAIPA